MTSLINLIKILVPLLTLLLLCSNAGQIVRASATTDIVSLELVGELDIDGWSFDIKIEDDFAYLSDYNNGLKIIDISTPTNPLLVGNSNLSKCQLSINNPNIRCSYFYLYQQTIQ